MATLIIQFARPAGGCRRKNVRTVRLMEGRNLVHITVNGHALCNRRRWLPSWETTKTVATCPGCVVAATKAVR